MTDDDGYLPTHFPEKAKITYKRGTEIIKQLNQRFNPYDICFTLKDIRTLNSSFALSGSNLGLVSNLLWQLGNHDSEALNVYIVDEICTTTDNGLICEIQGAAGGAVAIITDHTINVYPEDVTFDHEIGHCFGLKHAFDGHNASSGCERVTRNPSDPLYNANYAGDGIEDTNAIRVLDDINVNIVTCQYNNAPMVNCYGEIINVTQEDVDNIMNYSLKCANMFTEGQKEYMHNYLANYYEMWNYDYNGLDLMLRNTENDFGIEPDVNSEYLWVSPDIWVRNSDDDGLEHQNPISNTINYVYVRITNKSCETTLGIETLKLHWSKAGTNLPLQIWEGQFNTSTQQLGGLVDEFEIPLMDGYETRILKFAWQAPELLTNDFGNEPWHYCLLAKINSPSEIESLPISDGFSYLFRNSNNIALKNITLLENNLNNQTGSILVGNFDNTTEKVILKFVKDNKELNSSIFDEAEIRVKLDSYLFDLWQNSNFSGTNIRRVNNEIIVFENSEIIINSFPAKKFGVLNVGINFLTQNSTSKTEFNFHVIQLDDKKNVIGGEKYNISKKTRNLFRAETMKNENIISAISINESAVYNWYDTRGNLLHSGQYLNFQEINSDLLLEVIASDGFKDYVEIKNEFNEIKIKSVYPNPIQDETIIEFSQKTTDNMYLMLVNIGNLSISNYVLPVNILSINLSFQNIISGNYKIVLVKDDIIIDSKNLIKD